MNIILVLRFLHIGSVIAFSGGIFARQLARSVAARSENPQEIAMGFRLVDPIERYMVIPGSMATVLFGAILALLTGAPIFGFLQGASRNWLLVSNLLVIATITLVPTVFLPKGKVFGKRLEEAMQAGRLTPELRASLNDPLVRFAHTAEIVAVILVVILMVFKPI